VKHTPIHNDEPRCPRTGKIMFTSEVAARRRANRVAQTGKAKKSETCHSYQCEHCGGWHIGRDKSRDGRFSRHLREV
jgi:hypothetical protein